MTAQRNRTAQTSCFPAGESKASGSSASPARRSGIYRGDFAHDWIRDELNNLGVSTFGDRPVDDDNLLPERRYRLVVTVADTLRCHAIRSASTG